MATLFVPISLHVSPVLQDRHALALGWQLLLATALLGSTVQLAAHPSLPVQTYALQDPTVLLDQQALYPARLARSVLVRDLVHHLVYAVPDTTALAVPPQHIKVSAHLVITVCKGRPFPQYVLRADSVHRRTLVQYYATMAPTSLHLHKHPA